MTPWRPLSRRGAKVALVASAAALPEGAAGRAVVRLEGGCFAVRPGRALARRDGPWAHSPTERLADLRWAMTAPDIDLVWLARGGEGTAAVAAALPGPAIRPRPVGGMGDATSLHAALARHGIASIHGAMPSVDTGWPELAWTVPEPEDWPAPYALRGGRAEGRVVDGNLTCLAATAGTPLMPDTGGAIRLLEEVLKAAYRIGRCLTRPGQAGASRDVAAVALDTFRECEPSGGPDVAVLERHLAPLGVPVLAGLPPGHGPVQSALVHGVRCRRCADDATRTVLESPYGRGGAA